MSGTALLNPQNNENKVANKEVEASHKTRLRRVSVDRKSYAVPYTLVLSLPLPQLIFEHEYQLTTRTLGQGIFGLVKECVHRHSGRHFAVKHIPRKLLLSDVNAQYVQKEVQGLKKVRGCEGSVWLQDVFEDSNGVHIVMELLDGPDVVSWMDKYHPNETQIRQAFMRMVRVVQELHNMNIMHGDIKPQNFVFGKRLPNPDDIKIVDFGAANFLSSPTEFCKQKSGTRWYWAPDIFENKCGLKSDIWSLGVSLCFMLTSQLPFGNPDRGFGTEWISNMLSSNIVACNSAPLSMHAKQLIRKLLDPDLNKRPNCDQVLQHPWFQRSVTV